MGNKKKTKLEDAKSERMVHREVISNTSWILPFENDESFIVRCGECAHKLSCQHKTNDKGFCDKGMLEILTCKKCGDYGVREIRYGYNRYRYSCPNCGYSTKQEMGRKEAVQAWNQRGPNPCLISPYGVPVWKCR